MELNIDLEQALESLPACIRCRKRRIKCDSRLPTCRNCLKADKQCQFRDHVLGEDVSRQQLQSLIDRVQTLNATGQSSATGRVPNSLPQEAAQPTDQTADVASSTCNVWAASGSSSEPSDLKVSWHGPSSVYAYFCVRASASPTLLSAPPEESRQNSSPFRNLFESIMTGSRNPYKREEISLPAPDVIREILHHYQRSVEAFYPVLGDHWFSQLEFILLMGDGGISEDGGVHEALIRLVLAITFQLISRHESNFAAMGSAYFFSVNEGGLEEALTRPTLSTLQILTLMSIYVMLDRKSGSVWAALNHAICLDETLKLSSQDSEILSHVRDTLFILEVTICVAFGRPTNHSVETDATGQDSLTARLRDMAKIRLAIHRRLSFTSQELFNETAAWTAQIRRDLEEWMDAWQTIADAIERGNSSTPPRPSRELSLLYGRLNFLQAIFELLACSRAHGYAVEDEELATSAALIECLQKLQEQAHTSVAMTEADDRPIGSLATSFVCWTHNHTMLKAAGCLLLQGGGVEYDSVVRSARSGILRVGDQESLALTEMLQSMINALPQHTISDDCA